MKPTRKPFASRQGQSVIADDLRSHCVSTRLSKSELADLDARREGSGMQRGEYLRSAALSTLPTTIPKINRLAWAELSRAAANLNQIAKRLNENGAAAADVQSISAELQAFRLSLISAKRREAQPIHHDS